MSKVKEAFAEELQSFLRASQLFPPEQEELTRVLQKVLPSLQPRKNGIDPLDSQLSFIS